MQFKYKKTHIKYKSDLYELMGHSVKIFNGDEINQNPKSLPGHLFLGIHLPLASLANPFLHIQPAIQTFVQILGSGSPQFNPQCPLHGENTSLPLTSQGGATYKKKHPVGEPIK